jgi:formiminoglutamate deiminase
MIHATHMTADETRRLAASGAVAGLCPLTEASLGDGAFAGPAYLAAGGRFGVGSDSNIAVDAPGELRQLEYSQRLRDRSRNAMTTVAGESTGERLFKDALAGGAQAVARPVGAIEIGRRADIVVLDAEHPAFAAAHESELLDAWIFATTRSAVKTVYIGGEAVVEEGRHRDSTAITARYLAVLKRLADNV